MLGRDLVSRLRVAGHEVLEYDLPELDITRDDCPFGTGDRCDWAVNLAAYTDVDGAESARETAFRVNRDGAGRVAGWCAERGTRLLQVGTDYVFDGSKPGPYSEEDAPSPLNVYGASKLAGEEAIRAAGCRHVVVRTQSLFGAHGRSFVRAITDRLADGARSLEVVNDQRSCPTYTVHLAGGILRLLERDAEGTVHVSASGSCTWFQFACAIAQRVCPEAVVAPVDSSRVRRAAKRPANSALDKRRYTSLTGHRMPTWEEGLDAYLAEIGGKATGH